MPQGEHIKDLHARQRKWAAAWKQLLLLYPRDMPIVFGVILMFMCFDSGYVIPLWYEILMISHENPNFPYDIHPLFVIHFEIISLFPYCHSVGDNKGIASRLSRSMDQVKSLIAIYIYIWLISKAFKSHNQSHWDQYTLWYVDIDPENHHVL